MANIPVWWLLRNNCVIYCVVHTVNWFCISLYTYVQIRRRWWWWWWCCAWVFTDENNQGGNCLRWCGSLSIAVPGSRRVQENRYPTGQVFFFFYILCDLSSQAKAGWDESHLRLATGSCPAGPTFGCSTTSHRCNLQITIYGSVSSSGLSGSRQSSKTGQWVWF